MPKNLYIGTPKNLYFTKKGYQKLQTKRKNLERALAKVKRLSAPLARADPGNLWHDNAPFEEAERNIHKLTSLLEDVMKQLASAKILETKDRPKDKVGIGSRVRVEIGKKEHIYRIGGWGEYDLKKEKISYASPMGKALMGTKPGNSRQVSTPEGKVTIKILEIL